MTRESLSCLLPCPLCVACDYLVCSEGPWGILVSWNQLVMGLKFFRISHKKVTQVHTQLLSFSFIPVHEGFILLLLFQRWKQPDHCSLLGLVCQRLEFNLFTYFWKFHHYDVGGKKWPLNLPCWILVVKLVVSINILKKDQVYNNISIGIYFLIYCQFSKFV